MLRVFALGRSRVEKEGLPIDSPDWIQKPRELLYYLLSHPEGRTKEQIGLALWPEASAAQLRSSFHDSVFRLRRALGAKKWISFQKGRYVFGRSLSYSYDAEEFERKILEARSGQTEEPERAIRLLQEAADLYGGDYLEDLTVEGEWAFVRREVLNVGLCNAGWMALLQDDLDGAAGLFRESLSLAWESGMKPIVLPTLEGLACVAGARGEAQRAARLWGAAQSLKSTGIPRDTDWLAEADARISAVRSRVDEQAWQEATGRARAMSLEDSVASAKRQAVSG